MNDLGWMFIAVIIYVEFRMWGVSNCFTVFNKSITRIEAKLGLNEV